jgi:hypothetical protein
MLLIGDEMYVSRACPSTLFLGSTSALCLEATSPLFLAPLGMKGATTPGCLGASSRKTSIDFD